MYSNLKLMSKRLLVLFLLLGLQTGLIAQFGFTKEQLEQRKRHNRVNMHEEMQLTGKIRKLLYEPIDEYLNGFILETEQGKAFKIEHYFYLGKALHPYLKRGEQVRLTVKGDAQLLSRMLYKSNEDKRTEKLLGLKLIGLAHFQNITSSHGTFEMPAYDNAGLGDAKNLEVITDAKVVKSIPGRRKRIQLLIDNGDTINTYETGLTKAYYENGVVSYLRRLSPFPGALNKTNRTYHMVNPYISGPIMSKSYDLKMSPLGQRSSFLDEVANMRFAKSSSTPKGMVVHSKWQNVQGDTLSMTFSKKNQESFDSFLASHGQENVILHYSKNRSPRINYLYGLEKNGELVLLNDDGVSAQQKTKKFFYLSKALGKEEKEVPFTVNGTLKKYLTTPSGLYAGFRLVNEQGEAQLFRFLDTHGKNILNQFKEGDQIEVTAENISHGDLLKARFQTRRLDMETFTNPVNRTSNVLFATTSWLTLLGETGRKDQSFSVFSSRSPFVSRMIQGTKHLELDNNPVNPERTHQPSTLSIDVTIADVRKKKRNVTFFMENGDTLFMKATNGLKKGQKVSYLQKFPAIYEGQVYKDPNYANKALQAVWAEKRNLSGPLQPIYDDWMRLMAYESNINGKKGLMRISTDIGQTVDTYLKQHDRQALTLFCNEFIASKNKPIFYFFLGLQSAQGDLVFDNQVRQPQHYEIDTVFTSKIKEVIQHSDLYTYRNTTVVLENDFVFSISNTTFGSIGPSAFIGSEITVKGKPLIPREGELLKEESYRLIQPSFIKTGNVEFKISN